MHPNASGRSWKRLFEWFQVILSCFVLPLAIACSGGGGGGTGSGTPPATVTISGYAGIAGATLSYTDGIAKTATANGSGNYSFAVPVNWSGSVTPSSTGFTFSPASRTYTNVATDQSTQDFTAIPIVYIVSGNAGIAEAILNYTDGTAKTATADGSGLYRFSVSYDWTGTVTPSLAGYQFTPASRSYAHVLSDKAGEDYAATASAVTHTISGNAGIGGATLSYWDGTAKTTTANGAGTYTLTVPYGWSGALTPSLEGYAFTPQARTYVALTADQAAQNFSASAAPRTVSGTSILTFLPFNASNGSITPDPVPNPNALIIQAILADHTVLDGTYHSADGSYSIAAVPAGHYWLRAGNSAVWTDKSEVDLGVYMEGRKRMNFPSSPTTAVFNMSDMDPWRSLDELLFYDFNSNQYRRPVIEATSGIPAIDDTGLAGLTVDWSSGLIDTTKGDSPRLVQMVHTVNGTENTSLATKVYAPTLATPPVAFTMTSGAENVLNGSFAAIPQTAAVTLNYSRSGFAAYRSQRNPHQISGWGPFIQFDGVPGAAAYGDCGGRLGSLFFGDSDPSVTADLNRGVVSAPALPLGFEPVVFGGESFWMYYRLGSANPWALEVRETRTYTLTLPDATHPFQPLIGPARNPTINGLDLFSDQTVAGVTPTIAWTAPELGMPQAYRVTVYLLGLDGSDTTGTNIGEFLVDGARTSLQVPLGFLTTGNTYVFLISAFADSQFDPTTAPWATHRYPYGMSQAISNKVVLTP
jgi:hypothetical protein